MSLPDPKPKFILVIGALIISLAIWGGTSVVAKATVTSFPVFTILFLRFCVASIFLIPFYLHDGHRARLKKVPRNKIHWLLLLAFIGISVQIGLFFIGMTTASAMDANIISALLPLLIAVAGWVVLHEKFRVSTLTGLMLATIGITAALSINSPTTHHSLWGNLAAFGSIVSVVVYAIGSKKIGHYFCPLAITTTSFMVGMLTFGPLAAWEYIQNPGMLSQFTAGIFWGILYLGIISSVVAYWLYQWSIERVSATTVGTLSFVQPLSGMGFAAIFLGEQLTLGYVIGGFLTLVGILMAFSHPQLRLQLLKIRGNKPANMVDGHVGMGSNTSRSVVTKL